MAMLTSAAAPALTKSRTGIRGLDEITAGGLPAGRPTLVCGGPGCGKTLFAAEFLVRGATQFNEPGVFMLFEETAQDLAANVASLGFDVEQLIADGQLHVDYVHVDRAEIEEAGEYDLEGLFVRLDHAIRTVGAKRVALDTIEALFGGFSNPAILRAELRRLFRWLKERGVTAVITGERGENSLTRQGLEEYVSDCVILLDHRVDGQVSTRRLRIVKYRGSTHGTNEYPFLIDDGGFMVMPITSAGLDQYVSDERVSSGIADLDAMMEGGGYFRGSSVLLSGTAGTGKTTVCAHFADAACHRGERTLYVAFEESPAQIVRNIRSVGIDLQPHVDSGLLRFHSVRPTVYGLETHLARIFHLLTEFRPAAVVLDPLTALMSSAVSADVTALATRLLDWLKEEGITGLFTSLTEAGAGTMRDQEQTEVGMSSLVDTWILLRDIELNGERNRALYVLKSRGTNHSNQIREFQITSQGVRLVPAYLGPEGVLTGSSRLQQEAKLAAREAERRHEVMRLQRRFEQRQATVEAQIAALRADLESDKAELDAALTEELTRQQHLHDETQQLAVSRHMTAGGARQSSGNGGSPTPAISGS